MQWGWSLECGLAISDFFFDFFMIIPPPPTPNYRAYSGEDVTIASQFNLRWFTPICEVNLCGHATLATSAVIFNSLNNPNQRLTFSTLSGDLLAVKVGGFNDETGSGNITPRGSGGCKISLDLPLAETEPQNIEPITELIKIMIGDLPLADCRYSPKTKKLLLHLNDTVTRAQLESIKPDTVAMVTAHSGKIRGVIVTVKSHDVGYHFMSRYFAPWVGIPEDPVTGKPLIITYNALKHLIMKHY